ncbi:unnamed protein product [Closterium sp. Yama58-4]|nr:unnamed protein product [Closterium sp. Yama58-4]
MAPKKGDSAGGTSGKGGKAGSGKPAAADRKKFSVSSIVVEEKGKGERKPSVTSSSSGGGGGGKKSRAPPSKKPQNDYLAGVDLPPSDDEEEEIMDGADDGEYVEDDDVGGSKTGKGRGLVSGMGNLQMSDKQAKKKKEKELMIEQAQEEARKEALKADDANAFSVTLGSRVADDPSEEADGAAGSAADANVRDIKVENFSVSARGKELFRNASLTIVHGRRYGLVGPNGKGKSTVMKLLARRQLPVPRGIDVLLVEQEVVGDERSALEAVVTADQKLEMQARSTKSFSGGWRMRISLARALYVQPTLLLLDEPTNHLDLRAVLWLEEYLMRWKKTLIVVSHDRDFLNSVCTDIIHLHDEKLFFYKGNFEGFEEMYEQKRRENNKKFEVYEKQLKAAKRSGNKQNQDKVKDRAKFNAQKEARKGGKKSASSAGDADDDAPTEAPKRWRDYAVEFHFPEPTELTPPLLQLKEVSFSYPNRPDFALSEVDVGIDMGTRVAIVGPNGAGKSTLLNLLAGDLQPTQGESRQSQKLRIGRYSQHFVDLLAFDETPVEYLLRLYPNQEGPSRQEAVRSRLGKFGLPSHNHLTPIVKLSGGQKARVVFTAISMARPHILLLDEPTNHLDMQSIDALADALDEFTGGVVLVSHDSRLISRVCDDEERAEIWVVDNGTTKKFPGSFEDYKQQLIKEIIAEVED